MAGGTQGFPSRGTSDDLAISEAQGANPMSDLHPSLQAVLPMIQVGDWAGARSYLQKVAYGMPTATPALPITTRWCVPA